MKFLTLFFALVAFSTYSLNAQTKHQKVRASQKKNWTKQQQQFIEEIGLNQDDHRGIILNESSSATISIKEAIEEFLYSNDLSDLKKYNIIAESKYEIYLNKPLDLFFITELYLKLK